MAESIVAADLKRRNIRVYNAFWQLLWKLKDYFCNTYEVVENPNFWKKGKISSEKKFLAFLPYYQVW